MTRSKEFTTLIDKWETATYQLLKITESFPTETIDELRNEIDSQMLARVMNIFNVTVEEKNDPAFQDIFYGSDDWFWLDWEASERCFNYLNGKITAYRLMKSYK